MYHREGRVKDDETVLLNESLNILKGNCDLSGDFLSFSGEERRGSKSWRLMAERVLEFKVVVLLRLARFLAQ